MPRGSKPGERRGGRQKGVPNKVTREIRAASQALLSNPAYQKSLKARLRAGKAPHMEVLLHHYAHGKPKETMAIEADIPPFVVKVEVDDPTE